jgi:predicted PurR-regulated permease PerM
MNPRLRALVTVALILAVGALIWMLDLVFGRVRTVTTDIIIAVLVAYLLFPAVKPLSRSMPRGIAVLLVYVALIAVVGAAVAGLAPLLAAQAAQLAHDFPATMAQAKSQVSAGAPPLPIIGPIEPALRSLLAQYADRVGALTGAAAGIVGEHAVGVLAGTGRALVDTFVILLLAFFFITDVERIRALMVRFVPRERRDVTQSFIDDCDRVIGGFVRGQVLLALFVGVVATVVLLLTGVKYALLLGAFTGIASIVPLVGPIIGAIPAILVALFAAGPLKAAIVLALFVVVFEIQSHVLTPVVIGKAVGVTPLVIFLAILAGAEADGVLGMLLAVPLAGIARVVIDRVFPDDATDRALLAQTRDRTVEEPPSPVPVGADQAVKP